MALEGLGAEEEQGKGQGKVIATIAGAASIYRGLAKLFCLLLRTMWLGPLY